jgi:hypothetical protein
MDSHRFDDLTRTLATSTSRRQALKALGGGLLAALVPGSVLAKGGSNSACATFCAQVFGANTRAAGQCTSDAAKGKGLCYTCGPAAPANSTSKLCNGTCIPNDQCCEGCPDGQTCQNGTCVTACPSDKVLLSNGSCATPCTTTGASCGSCGAGVCSLDASGAIYCLNTGVPGNGSCSSDSNCPTGYFCKAGSLCARLC